MALSQVVSDCVRRWFQETLKEAKSGDLSMQVLVSQMYNTGYGVPMDAQKVYFISSVSKLNYLFTYGSWSCQFAFCFLFADAYW